MCSIWLTMYHFEKSNKVTKKIFLVSVASKKDITVSYFDKLQYYEKKMLYIFISNVFVRLFLSKKITKMQVCSGFISQWKICIQFLCYLKDIYNRSQGQANTKKMKEKSCLFFHTISNIKKTYKVIVLKLPCNQMILNNNCNRNFFTWHGRP
jgi:hypothetical protein